MHPKNVTLEQVAELTGGRTEGDASTRVRGLAPLHDAAPDHLALLADRRYLDAVPGSRAGAILVSEELRRPLAELDEGRPRVVVRDAHAALIPLLETLHPPREPRPGVHPTAVLGERVVLGGEVEVGPYAVLEAGVVLGDGVRVGAHCVVGEGARIGEESVLHPHVVLYPGSVVGRRCILHAGVRLGVDGFGYAMVDGAFRKVPQVGRCVIADDVEIGANTTLDRGSIGETQVGAGTKIDNLVHLAHNVRVGEGSAMAAQVGIAGSTRVGRGVVFGGQAGMVGHIEIGDRAQISAQAGVIGDVEPGATVTGYPARDLKRYLRAAAHMLRLPEMAKELRGLREEVEALRDQAVRDEGGGDGAPGG